MDTKRFLEKAVERHGDRYSYPDLINPSHKDKIKVICEIHGEFLQTCSNHLNGRGCRECGVEQRSDLRRKSLEDFLKDCEKVHGSFYDYSKVSYKGAKGKVKIICKDHGPFEQEANAHISGQGCPSCHNPLRSAKSLEGKNKTFISLAKGKHGDFYDYSKTEYVDSITKVNITCPNHGDFSKAPNKHLSGQGCPSCNKKQGIFSFKSWSYDSTKQHMEENHDKDCKLYLLKICMNGECFYKIGITTRENIGERITEIRKRSKPSTVDLITYESSDYLSCNLAEEILLSKFCDTEYNTTRKFKGHTECFLHDNEDSLKNCFSTVVSDVLTKPYEDRMSQFLGRCGSS